NSLRDVTARTAATCGGWPRRPARNVRGTIRNGLPRLERPRDGDGCGKELGALPARGCTRIVIRITGYVNRLCPINDVTKGNLPVLADRNRRSCPRRGRTARRKTPRTGSASEGRPLFAAALARRPRLFAGNAIAWLYGACCEPAVNVGRGLRQGHLRPSGTRKWPSHHFPGRRAARRVQLLGLRHAAQTR